MRAATTRVTAISKRDRSISQRILVSHLVPSDLGEPELLDKGSHLLKVKR